MRKGLGAGEATPPSKDPFQRDKLRKITQVHECAEEWNAIWAAIGHHDAEDTVAGVDFLPGLVGQHPWNGNTGGYRHFGVLRQIEDTGGKTTTEIGTFSPYECA